MHQKEIVWAGKKLKDAKRALVLLHGRGASPDDILQLTTYLNVEDYAILAPHATNHTWYPYSFLVPESQNEPWLSSAIDLLNEIVTDLNAAGIPNNEIYFAGFSQGACLSLEFIARNAQRWGGAAAFSGGLIGENINKAKYNGDFRNTPIFIGSSNPDPHIPVARVQETTATLISMKASVTEKIYQNMGHTISEDEIDKANQIIFNS